MTIRDLFIPLRGLTLMGLTLMGLALIVLVGLSAMRATAQEPRLRTGGTGAVAADGYVAQVFAQRLGDVSDLALHPDGTLYAADRGAGRIFRIVDRRLDGAADITQPLPQRFDTPTGLTVLDGALFVADRGGLWRVDPSGGTPDLVAPFARSGSTGDPHPVTALSTGSIRLGQSRPDGTAQLIDIDSQSGEATLMDTGHGTVIGFSRASPAASRSDPSARHDASPRLPVWPIVLQAGTSRFGPNLATAQPSALSVRAVWIDAQSGSLLVATPEGVERAAAQLDGIGPVEHAVLRGFAGQDAQPTALVQDSRGLFVADGPGGRIWRVTRRMGEKTAAPENAESRDARDEIASESPPAPPSDTRSPKTTPPTLLRGSGIERASTLTPALPPATEPIGDRPDPEKDQAPENG